MGREIFFFSIAGISILVTVVCILLLLSQRPTQENKYVTALLNLVSLYLVGYLSFNLAAEETMLLLGLKLMYLTGFIMCMFVIRIVTQVYDIRVPRWIWAVEGIWSSLLLFTVVIFSNSSEAFVFHLFYKDYEVVSSWGRSFTLAVHKGVFYYLFTVTCAVYITALFFMFVYQIAVQRRGARRDSIFFGLIVVCPQQAMFFSLIFNNELKTIPLIPFVFILSSIFSTLIVCTKRFNNLYDLANMEIANAFVDPVFVITNKLKIQSVNKKAQELYPEYSQISFSSSYPALPPELRSVVAPPARWVDTDSVPKYVTIRSKCYVPEVHRIERNQHFFGYVLRLDDITEERSKYLALETSHAMLSRDMQTREDKIAVMREKIVMGAIQFLLEKNIPTGEHMRRISNYVHILCKRLMKENAFADELNEEYATILCQVSPLHDVGKMFVPEHILQKSGAYTEEESRILASHPEMGVKIIDRMMIQNEDDLYYRLAKEVTLYHHEKFDGSGFPEGRKDDDIPLGARIVAVADVFDSLAMGRSRVPPLGFDKAFEAVCAQKGTRFDPRIIQTFIVCKDAFMEMYKSCSPLATFFDA